MNKWVVGFLTVFVLLTAAACLPSTSFVEGVVVESNAPRTEPKLHVEDDALVFDQAAIYHLAIDVDGEVVLYDVDAEAWATSRPGDSIRLDCSVKPCVLAVEEDGHE